MKSASSLLSSLLAASVQSRDLLQDKITLIYFRLVKKEIHCSLFKTIIFVRARTSTLMGHKHVRIACQRNKIHQPFRKASSKPRGVRSEFVEENRPINMLNAKVVFGLKIISRTECVRIKGRTNQGPCIFLYQNCLIPIKIDWMRLPLSLIFIKRLDTTYTCGFTINEEPS